MMSVTVNWLVEHHVILTQIYGSTTIEELHTGSNRAIELIRSADSSPIIHDIIDMREVTTYPTKLSELVKVTDIFKEPRLGWVIGISNNKLVIFLASIVVGVKKARLRLFEDPQEAIRFLETRDLTLSHLPALPPLPVGSDINNPTF
jgi:hypothetical protein